MRTIDRRFLMAAATAAATAAALGSRPRRAAAQAAPGGSGMPIRIGLITPLTGAQEVLGRPILTGAQIAADQINARGGVLGRRIEIVAADGAADPAVAAAAGKKLLSEGIALLCGALRSEVAFALWPLMAPANAVFMACGAMSEALTHEAFDAHCFRVCDHTFMRGRAQARLMAQRFPDVTDWAAIIPDIAYGHSAYAAFKAGLETSFAAVGRTANVAAPIVTRFGQTDFRTEVHALAAAPAKGLYVAVYGGDAIEFYRQARKYGAVEKMAVLADSINEFIVPVELGSDVPDNLWLGLHWYCGGYQNLALGRRLFEDNMMHTGDALPLGFLNEGHSAVLGYAAAIEKAGDTATDKVIAALAGLSFDTAKGRVTLRAEDHQAICDVNFVRIKRMDGEPGFEVAEFVRDDGANVIEPPAPGKPIGPV
jgi:branched-chain amino acid transport system substrate-binding protein